MATLYQNRSLTKPPAGHGGADHGYVEPDTSVPAKARPVLNRISVNGVSIAETDILAEAQNHPAENPGAALMAAARALVVRELLLQEARRLTVATLPQPSGDGRAETAEDAAIRALIEHEVKVPSASEREARRFYENNPARFQSETNYEARHILIAASSGDRAARAHAQEAARALIAHLTRHPGDFSALAAERSACPSRDAGGNLGQLTRGSTVPEFETALTTMRDGELLAQPVETRFGFHVILLERKIPGAILPFEHVRERIAGWLEAASWSKAVAQYIAALAGRAQISGIDISAADGLLVQ
jgi:peptidyl-prolyl cis-trans isomerase C